jgi:four helix bundle protein
MAGGAYDRSLELLRMLVPVMARLGALDAGLTDQLRRAAQSTALNVAEGNRRTLRDRRNRFRIALGSVAEVGSCLEVACALGYLEAAQVAEPLALVDRLRAMTYQLAR